jgi:hypothetical protein
MGIQPFPPDNDQPPPGAPPQSRPLRALPYVWLGVTVAGCAASWLYFYPHEHGWLIGAALVLLVPGSWVAWLALRRPHRLLRVGQRHIAPRLDLTADIYQGRFGSVTRWGERRHEQRQQRRAARPVPPRFSTDPAWAGPRMVVPAPEDLA